jgi:hypothetical protein
LIIVSLPKNERRLSSELSVQEIEQAEYKIIQTAQAECFNVEYQCLKKGEKMYLQVVNLHRLIPNWTLKE